MEEPSNSVSPWAWIFIAVMASIPLSTIAFLFTAPSHYDHYNPDFVEEIRPDRTMADVQCIEAEAQATEHKLPRPGEGYAHFNKHRETNKKLRYAHSCTVVVLGDIARSPRMMYHAASLASKSVRVEIVGYVESPLPEYLRTTKHVRVHPLRSLPAILTYLPFPLLAPLKLLHQSWMLYFGLCYGVKTATRHMLLQLPPSMPTLHVCLLACYARNTRLVCDWHNTASSILALRFRRNQSHPTVKIARKYELSLGRRASAHFAVSEAMKRYLIQSAGIAEKSIIVLRDRPAEIFKPSSSISDRVEFLKACDCTSEYSSDLTKKSGGWKLVVSSTSWTADEDFGMLLDSLVAYSSDAKERKQLPNLLVVITGKGPQQQFYLKKITQLKQSRELDKVVIRTAFLSHSDYAELLACADLGICLHKSSSGLDLPMKVADMFGAGLPVAGWSKYEAWPELVRDNLDGKGFDSVNALVDIMQDLLSSDGEVKLAALREGALKAGDVRWEQEWNIKAGGLLAGLK